MGEIKERYIIILDFDIAKHYNFGYSKPMSNEQAESVRELIYKETGKKFPIIDFTTIEERRKRNERLW